MSKVLRYFVGLACLLIACSVSAQSNTAIGPDATSSQSTPHSIVLQDPVEKLYAGYIAEDEKKLTNLTLNPVERQAAEWKLKHDTDELHRYQQGAKLWADLTQARVSKKPEQVAQAEAVLADYLTRQLEGMEKKKFLKPMTLKAVMNEYEVYAGHRPPSGWKTGLFRILLILVLLSPIIFWCMYALFRKKLPKP